MKQNTLEQYIWTWSLDPQIKENYDSYVLLISPLGIDPMTTIKHLVSELDEFEPHTDWALYTKPNSRFMTVTYNNQHIRSIVAKFINELIKLHKSFSWDDTDVD